MCLSIQYACKFKLNSTQEIIISKVENIISMV